MRIVAAAIAGAYALLTMVILLPWDAAECVGTTCVVSDADAQIFALGFTLWALTFPTLLLVAILLAVLGLRATRNPEEGAVLAALGQTRGTAIRVAALQGLRDGAIATIAAYVIAGGTHIAMLSGTGLGAFSTGTDLWLGRAVLAVTVIAALVLAHIITASRRPRTPMDALTADMNEEPAPRPSLKVRAMLSFGGLALSAGVIVALAYWKGDEPAQEVSFYVTNTAGIAMITAWLFALASGLWVVVPWLRRHRNSVLSFATSVAGQGSRVGAVLATYAGDRSRASARIVTVLAALGFLISSVPSQQQTSALDENLMTTVTVTGDVDATALAEAYRDVEGVADVVIASSANLGDDVMYGTVFAVTPDAIRSHDTALANALEQHPNAVAAPLWDGAAPTDLLFSSAFEAQEIVPIASCCNPYVNADYVELASAEPGFLIFVTDGADREATSEAIDRVTSAAPGINGYGGTISLAAASSDLVSVVINLTLAMVVLVLPLSLLAVGAVRRRRPDDATLTALGATARTMRVAIAVETAAVSAFAILGGMAVGAATRILMTALQQGRLSLGPVIVESPLATGVMSVPWGAIAVVGVSSVIIMTVAAFITAWATGRRARGPRVEPPRATGEGLHAKAGSAR